MKTWRTGAAALSIALLAAACGDGDSNGGEGGLTGTIAIDGSSTVAPLTEALAEEYSFEQGDVSVELAISGTGGGFERFCGTGDTDISNASRPIDDEEAQLCAENGIEYIEVRVGTDALTMVTSPGTDFLECLTTEQVAAVFGPDGATSWDQVDPAFPAEDITIFAPDTDSGTYDFLISDVLDLEASRQDYQASADDNVIVQGIQGTPASWGFFGFAYFQENEGAVEAISYDGGDGCVAPSVEAAQDDSYGLTRPLFIYVKQQALEEEHVADFVTYYLDNVSALIEDVGYIPAPQEELDSARQAVDDALAG